MKKFLISTAEKTFKIFRSIIIKYRIFFYKIRGCKIGKKVVLESGVKISHPENVKIDEKVAVGKGSIISAFKGIHICKNVQIASYCAIYDSDHVMPLEKGERKKSEVFIGENSWMGHGAVILKGVRLGKNVTVGAGSVVTKSFPDNSIIAGIPAKQIGENEFSEIA